MIFFFPVPKWPYANLQDRIVSAVLNAKRLFDGIGDRNPLRKRNIPLHQNENKIL